MVQTRPRRPITTCRPTKWLCFGPTRILSFVFMASQLLETRPCVQGRPPGNGNDVPLAVALIAATVLLYGASIFQYHGYAWAAQVCLITPGLCAAPHWVGLAAAAVAVFSFFKDSLSSR